MQICWGKACKFSETTPKVLASNPAKPRTHTLLGASGPVQENEMLKSMAVLYNFGCWSQSPVKTTSKKKQTNWSVGFRWNHQPNLELRKNIKFQTKQFNHREWAIVELPRHLGRKDGNVAVIPRLARHSFLPICSKYNHVSYIYLQYLTMLEVYVDTL